MVRSRYRGPLGFARGRLFDSDAFAMANASSLRVTVNIEGAGRGAEAPHYPNGASIILPRATKP